LLSFVILNRSCGPPEYASFKTFVLWQAVKGRMLVANCMTAEFVAIATPLLYCFCRATLYRGRRVQVLNLRAFAATDPDRLIEGRPDSDDAEEERPEHSAGLTPGGSWSIVLEVLPSATIEEVKQAYRSLVKKNHPDRVQDMSPAFVELAEAETKKINAAYEEALTYFRQDT
jgi:hypothetical protein